MNSVTRRCPKRGSATGQSPVPGNVRNGQRYPSGLPGGRKMRYEYWLPRMRNLLQDLVVGIRLLAKNPGLTIVAVLSLGLGIGANTAIFTIVNALFIQPVPVQNPER